MRITTIYLPRKTPYHISKNRDGTKFLWRAIIAILSAIVISQLSLLDAQADKTEDASTYTSSNLNVDLSTLPALINNDATQSDLAGTLTVYSPSADTIAFDVFLQNTGSGDLPPFTVIITGTQPSHWALFRPYDEACEQYPQYSSQICSTIPVNSLDAGRSITQTTEVAGLFPSICRNYDTLQPFIQELEDAHDTVADSIETVYSPNDVYEVLWTSIQPFNAMAVFDNDLIVDLHAPEPLLLKNSTCFEPPFEEPPMPTPNPTTVPTSEPSTILLPVFAKE